MIKKNINQKITSKFIASFFKTESDFSIFQFTKSPKNLQTIFFNSTNYKKFNLADKAFIVDFKKSTKIEINFINQLINKSINLFISLPADCQIIFKETIKKSSDNFLLTLVIQENSDVTYYLDGQKDSPDNFFYYIDLKQNAKFNLYYLAIFQKNLTGAFLINHQKNNSVGNILGGLKVTGRSNSHVRLINNHIGKNTTGDIKFKALGEKQAISYVEGLIKINEKAKNTNSYLTENILMLSDDCQIQTKPNLEIANHEVKASHSASIGRIDQNAVYYLMSRGLNRAQATKLITNSFLAEIKKYF